MIESGAKSRDIIISGGERLSVLLGATGMQPLAFLSPQLPMDYSTGVLNLNSCTYFVEPMLARLVSFCIC